MRSVSGGRTGRRFTQSRVRRLGTEFAFLAASTAAFQGTRLVAGLIAAAVLAPAEYGLWGLFLAVLSYSVYSNLGLLSGANRDIPISLGRGDVSSADALERVSYAGSIVVAAAIAVVVVLATLMIKSSLVLVALAAAAALSLQQLYLFCQMALRARLRFNAASFQQLVLALVFPLTALPLLFSLGISALFLGQTAAYMCGVAMVLFGWRRDLRPAFDMRISATLVVTGLPIMVGGLIFAFLTTADRWLVLALLGDVALGKYTVASLLSSGMLLVSMVVAQQFYPRMAMRYGRHGTDGLKTLSLLQGGAVLVLLAPVVVMLAVFAPWAIRQWLPTYADAVPALFVLAAGYVVLLSGTGFWNLLIVVGRADVYVFAQILAVLIEIIASIALVRWGHGLVGIATAAAISFTFLTCAGAVSAAITERQVR